MMSAMITFTPADSRSPCLTRSTPQRSVAGTAVMNSPRPAAGSRTQRGSPILPYR
jgi:hypothetical protein